MNNSMGVLKQKDIKMFNIKCAVCNSKKIKIHFEQEHECNNNIVTIINRCYIICNKCNAREIINSSLDICNKCNAREIINSSLDISYTNE